MLREALDKFEKILNLLFSFECCQLARRLAAAETSIANMTCYFLLNVVLQRLYGRLMQLKLLLVLLFSFECCHPHRPPWRSVVLRCRDLLFSFECCLDVHLCIAAAGMAPVLLFSFECCVVVTMIAIVAEKAGTMSCYFLLNVVSARIWWYTMKVVTFTCYFLLNVVPALKSELLGRGQLYQAPPCYFLLNVMWRRQSSSTPTRGLRGRGACYFLLNVVIVAGVWRDGPDAVDLLFSFECCMLRV